MDSTSLSHLAHRCDIDRRNITKMKSADPGRRQGGARQGREGFGSQQQQQQRGLQRQLQQQHQQQQQEQQEQQQQQQARQLQSFCSEQNPEGTSSLGQHVFGGRSVLQ